MTILAFKNYIFFILNFIFHLSTSWINRKLYFCDTGKHFFLVFKRIKYNEQLMKGTYVNKFQYQRKCKYHVNSSRLYLTFILAKVLTLKSIYYLRKHCLNPHDEVINSSRATDNEI